MFQNISSRKLCREKNIFRHIIISKYSLKSQNLKINHLTFQFFFSFCAIHKIFSKKYLVLNFNMFSCFPHDFPMGCSINYAMCVFQKRLKISQFLYVILSYLFIFECFYEIKEKCYRNLWALPHFSIIFFALCISYFSVFF